MTTQQTDALQCAANLEYSIARHGMQDAFTLNAYRAMKMVRAQHARITELESQLAQRFDAADVATAAASGFLDGSASAALASTPAQPAAQHVTAYAALPDEREAFESWLRSVWTAGYGCPKLDSGKYVHDEAQRFWECWQARASHGQAPAGAYTDSTPHLKVGDSSFESWYAGYVKEGTKGLKQHCRDAYAAGMGDPLVGATPTPQSDSVQEDAALWRWLAEYLVGTRTDLDDEIVACETVNDLRKLVEAAIKQGEQQ